jgi:hypothetical protein
MYVHRTVRFIVGAMLAAFVMAGIGAGVANAQEKTPAQLLQANPSGGQLLINALEQLVLTNPELFKTVLGSVGGANEQQRVAIATALSQAAKTMVLTNPERAGDWQEQILAVTDPAFKTAAINAFGDVKLGAVGGGPLGGPLGGPAGGPGGGSGGSLESIVSPPTNTGFFTFGAGTGGLGFVGGVVNNGSSPNSPSTSTTIISGGVCGTPGNLPCPAQ